MPNKVALALFIAAAGLSACRALSRQPSAEPTRTATPVAASPTRASSTSVVATATGLAPRTPAPILDLRDVLLTQAYAWHTPRSTRTATAAPSATADVAGAAASPAPAAVEPTPASVYFNEPVNIPNAVATARCEVRGVGACEPVMAAGTDTYFTWTFGVTGSGSFSWGQAAVATTRDGQPFAWAQVGNGLARPPGLDRGWVLQVGQQAEFRAGMEDLQPGAYTARLVMCTRPPVECNGGDGWLAVGGPSIQFIVTE